MRRLVRDRTRLSAFVVSLGVAVTAMLGLAGSALAQRDDSALQRLLSEAERLERDGEYLRALREYELLVRQFPSSGIAPEALLRVARRNWQIGNEQAASNAAKQLVESYPRSRQAAGGFVLQGEIQAARAGSLERIEEAKATLRKVWLLFDNRSYPGLDWRAAARVKDAELERILGNLDSSTASFLAVLEDEPPSGWRAQAQLGLGTNFLMLGDWHAAAGELQQLVDRGSRSTEEGAAAVQAAEERLTLIHRLILRPQSGARPWVSSRNLGMSGLKRPVGVAVGEDGRLAITDSGTRQAYVIDGTQLKDRYSFADVARPSWSRFGHLTLGAGDTVEVPISNSSLRFLAPTSQRSQPVKGVVAAEHGALGQWFVLADDRVLSYSAGSKYQRAVMDKGDGDAADLHRDSASRLYVLDSKGNSVMRYQPDGTNGRRVASGSWRDATALAVDLLGNIYVLDEGTRTIDVIDQRGQRVESLGPGLPGGQSLREPTDIAVDGSGRIYVADASGAVVVVE